MSSSLVCCGAMAVITMAQLISCAGGRAPAAIGSRSMPDPAGCYVLVYEAPQFSGAREYINGPGKYANLTNLPFRVNWRHRIRSVQVGTRALVTVWTDEEFKGASQQLPRDSIHPVLARGLDREAESLEVACAP